MMRYLMENNSRDSLPPMECYRHPKIETLLCCGKCDRPICPKCTIYGPAGTRCRECSSLNSSPLFQVGVDKLALGISVCLCASVAVGVGLGFLSTLGFLLIWGGLLGGGFIAEALLRSTGRKRGSKMEIIAGVCSVVGLFIGHLLWRILSGAPFTSEAILSQLQHHPFYVLSMLIAAGTAVSRIRYM